MPLRLAIPAKGRMHGETVAWLGSFGINIARDAEKREYAALASGLRGLELALIPAGDIPGEVASGAVHIGVTGMDMMSERIPRWRARAEELGRLGFGRADLSIAVPKFWVDVDTVHDLDEAAAQFRRHHGWRLRIATKYAMLAREFLSEKGVADYQLVESAGATEGAVSNQSAEAIADIVSTGRTLEANGLKRLRDGRILKSEAALFMSRRAELSADGRQTLKEFLKRAGVEPPGANSRLSGSG